MHTLVLLDIKVKEQSEEDLIKGRMVFQPPRFMTVNVAARQLLEAENEKKGNILNGQTYVFACMRLGGETQAIVVKSLEELAGEQDFGPPLHSLVIPGEMDEVETLMFNFHKNS